MPGIRSKREALRDLLVEGIRSGRYPVGARLPSEGTLARSCQVSRDTVRAVLDDFARRGVINRRRGSGTWLAPDAEQRLGLSDANRLRVTMLLPPDRLANPIYLAITSAFLERLDSRAKVAIMIRQRPDPGGVADADVVVCDGTYPKTVIAGLAAAHRHLILVNRQHPELPFACTDNRAGGILIAEHALALGHRRIGIVHLGESGTEMEFILRLRGIRHVLAAAGIDPLELGLSLNRIAEFDANAWVHQLRRSRRLPTAMLCVTDNLALHAIELFTSHKMRVPEDIGVSGFDDVAIGRLIRPGLTTVRQPVEALGAALAAAVSDVLEGREIDLHRPLRPILVPRATLLARQPS